MQCCAYRRQDGHLECRVPGWLRGALLRLGQHLASFPGERSGVWEFPGKCGTRGEPAWPCRETLQAVCLTFALCMGGGCRRGS